MHPGLRSPVLVGRAPALVAVRRALTAAGGGAGGLVLVTGEAGIGKSRLLDEAVGHAERLGLVVLRGRAVEGGGPYRPIAEAALRLVAGQAAAGH